MQRKRNSHKTSASITSSELAPSAPVTATTTNGRKVSSVVIATYDFAGDPNKHQITIQLNETLSVLKEADENGWCWGVNTLGQEGYFPASYTKLKPNSELTDSKTAMPEAPTSSVMNDGDVTVAVAAAKAAGEAVIQQSKSPAKGGAAAAAALKLWGIKDILLIGEVAGSVAGRAALDMGQSHEEAAEAAGTAASVALLEGGGSQAQASKIAVQAALSISTTKAPASLTVPPAELARAGEVDSNSANVSAQQPSTAKIGPTPGASEHQAPTLVESVRSQPKYAKYRMMLKTGLPDGAVRQKMVTSGMSEDDIAAFFGESGSPSSGASALPGGLFAQIAAGNAKKKLSSKQNNLNSSAASGGDLLSAIKAGAKLKKVDATAKVAQPPPSGGGGMGGMLAELQNGASRLRKADGPSTRRRAETAPAPVSSGIFQTLV
jgi:hypothetical protein